MRDGDGEAGIEITFSPLAARARRTCILRRNAPADRADRTANRQALVDLLLAWVGGAAMVQPKHRASPICEALRQHLAQ